MIAVFMIHAAIFVGIFDFESYMFAVHRIGNML